MGSCRRRRGLASNGQPLNTAENTVRTFFVDVIEDKTVIINDKDYPAVAKILGCANLTINALPRNQVSVKVTKDLFVSMDGKPAYDVGDIVKLEDDFNNINKSYRIQVIDVTVQEGAGEDITLTLGYPNYKYQDEMQSLYRKLKSYGIVGTFNSDWTAQGTDKQLLDARLISTQSQYSVNAQNEKIAQTMPYNGNLFSTREYLGDGTYKNVTSSNFMWSTGNQWFGVQAGRDNKTHDLQVSLLGTLVQYHNGTQLVDGADAANIHMYWNPHLVMDIKCCDGKYYDLATSVWKYDHWKLGDFVRIGMAKETGDFGFWFMIIKINDNSDDSTGMFDVYVQWSLENGVKNFNLAQVSYNNAAGQNGAYLKTINANHKYKIEMVTESSPDFIAVNKPNVKFNLYEYKTTYQIDNQGVTMNYVQLAYPTMGICSDNGIYSMTVKPLFVQFKTSAYSSNNDKAATVFFYNFQTEWKVQQVDYK